MPKRYLNRVALFALFLLAAATVSLSAQDMAKVPVTFTANAGQWDHRVHYQAKLGGAVAWVTGDGIDYQFYRDNAKKSARNSMDHRDDPKSLQTMLIGAKFVNANPVGEVAGEGMVEYRCNYFLGNDSTKWRTDVPNFESVIYRDLYRDIDLKIFSAGQRLEYDFVVQPGGDLAQVEIEYKGIRGLAIDTTGNLLIKTRWGTVTEHAPVVFQEVMGQRQILRASYEIRGKNRYGFKLHDEYNSAIALIVDPLVSFSTYLGGLLTEYVNDLAVNGSGEVIVCGETYSADYPFAAGYDNVRTGTSDACITKFNASGSGVVFSTFVGGSGLEAFSAVNAAVEAAFGLVMTGETSSSDFPTASAFDATLGGPQDAIVVRMSAAGNSLIMSTLLGGAGTDNGSDVVARCVSLGCSSFNYGVYVTGTTQSIDFPTVNASQTTKNGSGDAFVSVYSFTSSSSLLSYSTYYGGSGFEVGSSIAAGGVSPVTITIAGITTSNNLPGIDGYDNVVNGQDIYVAMLTTQSGQLGPTHATYFGGDSVEVNPCISVPLIGTIILTGSTNSSGLGTAGAYDSSFNGVQDAFLAKFSSNGAVLDFATYLGGNNETTIWSHPSTVARDADGNLYITGSTKATNFPLANPVDSILVGSDRDGFIAKFNSSGSALSFCSLIGGSDYDAGLNLAVDQSGCVYVTGTTQSSDFPMVAAFDNSLSGTVDIFVTKVCNLNCCVANAGNVDCDPGDGVDISDLSRMIDFLYISFAPLCCKAEANTDGSLDGNIDISDLSVLIDYLYISFTPPAACQ